MTSPTSPTGTSLSSASTTLKPTSLPALPHDLSFPLEMSWSSGYRKVIAPFVSVYP